MGKSILAVVVIAVSLGAVSFANRAVADADDGGGADLTVTFTSVTDKPGNLIYSLYDTEETYNIEKNEALNGTMPATEGSDTLELHHLKPGFYALTVFHDENGNGKLDTDIFGRPKEQFGISNINRILWSKPKWDEVKFEVKDGEPNEISIRLKMQ